MSEHYYQYDHHRKRHKAIKKFKWFTWGIALAILIIIAIIFLVTSLIIQREPVPVTSSVQTSIQAPSIKVFRTQYFQFQTGDNWVEDAKQTTDTKFVYRAYRGPLIEHDLTIYVNPKDMKFDTTRVQPVVPKADGTFRVDEGISEHCDAILPKADKDRQQDVKFREVTFFCDADETIFDVLVGKVGGTPYLDLTRPDGTTARYVIYYRDLTANPTGRELKEIVKSFQTR